MEGESTYACSSKIVLDVPVYYYYLHFTYLIFHNIYRALGTNRSNLEVSCNGERKKAYFPIPSTDNILNILIFSLLLVFINLVTRMDRILWALRGKKSVHFFLFFRFSTASWKSSKKAAIVGIVISHIYEAVHKRRSFVKLRVQIRA